MIGYVTLGTNDLERATKFYDALPTEFGAKRIMETERSIVWKVSTHSSAALSVIKPFDGNPATTGIGVMVGFFPCSISSVSADRPLI